MLGLHPDLVCISLLDMPEKHGLEARLQLYAEDAFHANVLQGHASHVWQ